MRRDLFLTMVLGVFFLKESHCKPTEIVADSDVLDPVAITVNNESEIVATRKQRSPQYGLLGNYGDYSDYDDNAPYFRFGHKRKLYQHKPYHHKPHGCRRYGCGGGWQPHYGNYHHTGQGASFASASAGSISGGGPYGGGQSGANAQSASFNIGPFSASFSAAQSSSGYSDGF
ncbi:uncharacterized protein LOC126853882 [Cataglyphis hispanica]|uniref:uncharacterized protein LOC126853882 n=1 Tax=Cataglyphis hispanica TaxID=1086592 RepID=UPI00217FA9D9|nr:uncharacterized protein LOC126853882 [Cataglyphis hispanica]XP_050455955.1 uncharacterized protein LOC126853882 [Cataglyphis hispanica]